MMSCRLSDWLLVLLCLVPLGCATLESSLTSPDRELATQAEDEAAYVQATVQEEPPLPQVVAVPEPIPMPGQLKRVDTDGQGCPICIAKGIPLDKQRPDHTHKAHEIIDYANQQARKGPDMHGYIDSVQVYDYMPGALFQVYTAPTSVTSVMLQPSEQLTTFAAGDTVRWIVEATTSGQGPQQRDLVLVKPVKPGLHTNLVLTTTKRTYLLELHSYQHTYMAAVSWHYPHETLATTTQHAQQTQRQAEQVIAPQVHLQDLYFQYDITSTRGDPRWKPVRVFDDGRKTYIQFPAHLATSEAPALFILASHNQTQLVNYRVKGQYYIVDRLFEQAELRVGTKKAAVVRITRHEPHASHI